MSWRWSCPGIELQSTSRSEEQAHAFELGSLCEDAAFSAIERLNEQTVVQLVKGLRTFYKA